MSNLIPDKWMDPLTKDEFLKKDIITIQDPNNLDKFNMSTFYHTNQNTSDKGLHLIYFVMGFMISSITGQAGTTIRISSSLAAEALKEVQESIQVGLGALSYNF